MGKLEMKAVALSLGLIESFAFGVYVGVVFTPIYNWITRGQHTTRRMP